LTLFGAQPAISKHAKNIVSVTRNCAIGSVHSLLLVKHFFNERREIEGAVADGVHDRILLSFRFVLPNAVEDEGYFRVVFALVAEELG
jgi:hypothetical protein